MICINYFSSYLISMKLTVSYVHHKLIMKPIIKVLLYAVVSLDFLIIIIANTPNYNFDLITGKAFIGKFTECMPSIDLKKLSIRLNGPEL